MLNRRKLFFLFSLLTLFSIHISAQTSTSPYSRYGIGDLPFHGTTKNLGMGGVALGYSPIYNLNLSNPAAYSSLLLTTFEAAVNMNQVEMKNGSAVKQDVNNTSFSYFGFGFPVKSKKWGTGFGLLPYSDVGYSLSETATNSDGDAETHTYEGSGGLNQFFISNGYSPFKNFSIGVTASYLFGTIEQERRIEFPRLSNYFNTRINQETSIGSFHFNFGTQLTFDSLRLAPSDSIKIMDKKLGSIHDSLEVLRTMTGKSSPEQKNLLEQEIKKLNDEYVNTEAAKKKIVHRKDKSDWSLTLGLVASPKTSLSATNTTIAENFLYNAFGNIVVRDTIVNREEDGKIILPFNAGFGLLMKKGNRWLIGSDFSLQNWKDYSNFGATDSLANSWRVSAGMQFSPNDRAIKSFWKNVQYRFGLHYEQTYLQLHNNQLNEFGLSLGFGIPVKRSAAMLHISGEIGKRGTVSGNLIEENYIKLSLGFTLNDRWFIRTKID
jgi:hypothetical protein